ncbi:hypothetical protein BW247_05650 [Acidihalobacter ferrooxydans]|uniref:Bacterial type II secretion system protein E domain-containing protein n=2 Tax=Acidihalobacter ferrooxydans TaxID=1765967 RepID=A0A1P8UFM8_9GAMM|nr:hypothetical protein BW247_05650 [Acidihalobacter ferrooxydans]
MDPIAHRLVELNHNTPFTDANLAPGQPLMIRTPAGYQPADDEPLDAQAIETFLALPGMAGEGWRERMQNNGGSWGFARTTRTSRLRISLYETGGEKHTLRVAIRRLPLHAPDFEDIGLPSHITNVVEQGRGLFLITGPTGAGKSTTLASLLERINRSHALHIQTIEEPIEYVFKPNKSVISQVEVPVNVDSFEHGVHAALRHRPDIIAIGKMRDRQTVSAALQAASSGHFVLGTLHTASVDETVDAVLQFFDGQESEQKRMLLASALIGIISQTLLPDVRGEKLVLAHELMLMTPGIANLIRQNKIQQLSGAIEEGRSSGMCTLNDSLNRLVREGRVSKTAAFRAAYTREGLNL